MAVFKAGSPQSEVDGKAIATVLKSIQIEFLKDKLLEEHSLHDVKAGDWVPTQHYLNLLKTVHNRMPAMLKNIGSHIFSSMVFPPGIDTFEKGLSVIDKAYQMAHRGGGDIGHYRFSQQDDGALLLSCDNPYPCPFDEGIIEGIARAFQGFARVRHADDQCRMNGSDCCNYTISVRHNSTN